MFIKYIHVLLAKGQFIPNPKNLPLVDHIDVNKHNNQLSNLRWITRKGNGLNRLNVKGYSKTPSGKD
jgi:hypothetical protein